MSGRRKASLAFAKRMRHAPVYGEAQLWRLLRGRRVHGLKFRRQVPIGPYVVDFLCLAHRLVVEADGPFHDSDHDERRDRWLESQGFRVLRFPNAVISTAPEEVRRKVCDAVRPNGDPGLVPSPLAGEGLSEADG
jgi:very-short-patch-repair endonuclease